MADPHALDIAHLTLPGHDRDVARAILNQARLRSNPITDTQVVHLIDIGRRAGRAAATAEQPTTLLGRLRWAFRPEATR